MSESQFRPRFMRSLRQQVAEALREAIMTGKLKPGDRIVEAEIAAELGVSRGPVREALRQLEHEGLICSHPYRETVVTGLTGEEVREVFIPIRAVLELFAVRKLVVGASAATWEPLEEIIRQMEAAVAQNDLNWQVECDLAFHRKLLELSGHQNLLQIWSGINSNVRRQFLINGKGYSDLHELVAEHRELLQALKSGNLNECERIWMRHLHTLVDR